MQAPLLIYFKENEVEFWSIDQNKRLIPINCGTNNKAPLYFFVSNDQIAMDQNAKMQFESNVDNSYGNYWSNLLNPQLKYNRYNASHQYSTLLSYSIKENILPAIIRFNYSSFTKESFLNKCKTIIVYDSFIDEQHRNIINKELLEIIGFNPSCLVSFDYWELFRSYYEKNGKLNPNESFISINSALGDLNINLIAQNPTLTINKKTLKGRGNDPRVDTILDYVAELAIRKGSLVSIDEIKKRLINEGPAILELLKDGWVDYKIKNTNIGIYPLKLEFHRSAIDNRLNNRASLNYIQGELDSFRNNNHANGFKLFLNGEIINQDVFINFFNTTYSNVESESVDFENNFKKNIFSYYDELKIDISEVEKSSISINEDVKNKDLKPETSNELNQNHTSQKAPIIILPNTIKPTIPNATISPVPLSVNLPPTRVSAPPLPPVSRPPVLPTSSVNSAQLPPGAKPKVSQPLSVSTAQMPPGVKPKISSPPIESSTKLPPGVKPTMASPKAKLPPPPPPPPPKIKNK
jgi:hypothetical protein